MLNHAKESSLTLVLVLAVLLIIDCRSTTADDLVYTFRGVLPTGSTAHSSVSDGETFTAIFTIDPNVSDSDGTTEIGLYSDGVVSGALVFSGGYVAPLDFSDYDVFVFDDAGPQLVDGVCVREPSGNIIQASNRDLFILSSDALPLDGTQFQSGPEPETEPFFQLEYSDAGGTICYTAQAAHNVEFQAKDGVAFSNVGTISQWYDISSNWLAGIDLGPPSDTDTALFNLSRTYDVWWNSITGDRTAEYLCVSDGIVTFDNRDSGTYTFTINRDAEISGSAECNLGDGTDTVNLDVDDLLLVDGDLNAFAGTTVIAGLGDIGCDAYGQIRLDGPGTTLQVGGAALFVGVEDLGDLLITNGAVATDDGSPRIGVEPGGNGLAIVDGAGSQWNAAGTIHVGNTPGTVGFLTVSDDASVDADGNIEAGFEGDGASNTITVDNALLTSSDSIRIGGVGSALLSLIENAEVSAANQIFVAPAGTIESSGLGVSQLSADAIFNAGQMIFAAAIGTDIDSSVVNTGTIHSEGTGQNFFLSPVIHDGAELRTDPNAESCFFDSVSGSGNFTGTGDVDFRDSMNPGDGSGIGTTAAIAFAGDVTLSSTSTLNIELGSTDPADIDRLLISGDLFVSAGGSLSVNPIAGLVPCDKQVFPIIRVDGIRIGTFNGLPEGAVVGTFGPTDLFISYVGGDGNDIVLNAVSGFLLGDVNLDCEVNLLDIQPFVDLIVAGGFQAEADINGDFFVNLLDVDPFVALLTGG